MSTAGKPESERLGIVARAIRLLGILLAGSSLVFGVLAIVRSFDTGVNDAYVLIDLTNRVLPAPAQAWLLRITETPGIGRVLSWALDVPLYAWAGLLGILLLITVPSRSRHRR